MMQAIVESTAYPSQMPHKTANFFIAFLPLNIWLILHVSIIIMCFERLNFEINCFGKMLKNVVCER